MSTYSNPLNPQMECNKDEALRAKSVAEGKLEQNDYAYAKKFALKAQSLYPGLDGISQMLKILEVYVAAENKIRGQVDWYGVLVVDPKADDETIKRQYKKLALMVHPDKNTSVGADGAFKLISAAWTFLSDKAKRLDYNKRRGYSTRPSQQRGPSHTGGPSAPTRPSQQKVPSNTGGSYAPTRPSQQKVPSHTGGPSVPTRPSQQKVPSHTGGPSAPTRPIQQKVPSHTGGPSAPTRPSQQKVPRPSNCASREASVPKPQEASRKQTSAPSEQKVPSHNGGPSRPSQHKGPGPSNCASRETSAPRPQDTSAETSAPSRPIQQKVPMHTGGPSTPSSPNERKSPGPSTPINFASRKISAPKPQDISAMGTPSPSQLIFDKFWTTCDQCNSQHEYLKLFRNCILECKKCEKSFKASETVHQPNL